MSIHKINEKNWKPDYTIKCFVDANCILCILLKWTHSSRNCMLMTAECTHWYQEVFYECIVMQLIPLLLNLSDIYISQPLWLRTIKPTWLSWGRFHKLLAVRCFPALQRLKPLSLLSGWARLGLDTCAQRHQNWSSIQADVVINLNILVH